jgi:DNA repair exonuclease SbcCD nuclease subunit
MSKPKAVLISDVHYNLQTLEIADKAVNKAFKHANRLEVPLIICGDLHDTKANIRGECMNAMKKTLEVYSLTSPVVLRGNHDSINEKSKEHSLSFLKPNCIIIDEPFYSKRLECHLIPYHHDANELRQYLKTLPPKSTLIMHQGINSSNAGHYYQDKSALNKEDLAGFRVISGHYHTRQSFDLPDGGKFDYVGNPFTLNYAEADDPPKGYQILYDDGSLEFVPTNLRKHVVVDIGIGDIDHPDLWQHDYKRGDLLWVKVSGDKQYLNITKKDIANRMKIEGDFKLDLISTDITTSKQDPNKPQFEVLDTLIDSLTNTDDEQKSRLKDLWKQLED